eukprot:6191216-Pleurochrysis_carterae.AAC.2
MGLLVGNAASRSRVLVESGSCIPGCLQTAGVPRTATLCAARPRMQCGAAATARLINPCAIAPPRTRRASEAMARPGWLSAGSCAGDPRDAHGRLASFACERDLAWRGATAQAI